LRSFSVQKKFDPVDISKEFLLWLSKGPRDVGSTTRFALLLIKHDPTQYWLGGLTDFHKNPNNSANGSLMRNGPIPLLLNSDSEDSVITASVLQSIITHFAPTPVLACVVHSLLIFRALNKQKLNEPLSAPTSKDVNDIVKETWKKWKNEVSHDICKLWLATVNDRLEMDETAFLQDIDNFVELDPYHYPHKGVSGWSTLSLKICLWALHYSFTQTPPSCGVPAWLPLWPFEKRSSTTSHGFRTILWIVLIGSDADTYGAIGGALLGTYHPHDIPLNMVKSLKVFNQVEQAFEMLGVPQTKL